MKKILTLEEKVRAAAAGDAEYYAEICTAFMPLAKSMAARSFVRPISSEVYSLAVQTIAESVKQYRQECGVPFSAFVYKQVKYAVWNLYKRERRLWQNTATLDEAMQVPSGDAAVEAGLLAAETIMWLRGAVSELPPMQRHVIEAYFFAGRRNGEIAAELHISPPAVSGLKQRALDSLRRRQDFADLW